MESRAAVRNILERWKKPIRVIRFIAGFPKPPWAPPDSDKPSESDENGEVWQFVWDDDPEPDGGNTK